MMDIWMLLIILNNYLWMKYEVLKKMSKMPLIKTICFENCVAARFHLERSLQVNDIWLKTNLIINAYEEIIEYIDTLFL